MSDAPQPDNVPIDEEAISEPVAGENEDEPIEQTNVGRANMEGTGEWPDPDEPPTGPAPGTDPARQDDIEADRVTEVAADPPGSGFKEVLEANPAMGGANSIKDKGEVYVDERRSAPAD